MIPLLPIAIGGVVIAGLSAACSSWEDDNEAAEAELEERRSRYARTIRRRRARLLRNRKMKVAMLNLAAVKKQLAFAEQAAKVARRYLDVGTGRLESYKNDMRALIRHEIAVPEQAALFERQYLANVEDMASTYRKCRRQVSYLQKRKGQIEDAKFYFTCSRCHRKFAVRVGELERFKASKVNGKVYCASCR